MAGFVEIAKIIIKVGFYALIVLIILSIVSNLLSLTPIFTWLSTLTTAFHDVIQFAYNVLYFWTGGAFRYIYTLVISVITCKITFWTVYGGIQAYKILSNWIMK